MEQDTNPVFGYNAQVEVVAKQLKMSTREVKEFLYRVCGRMTHSDLAVLMDIYGAVYCDNISTLVIQSVYEMALDGYIDSVERFGVPAHSQRRDKDRLWQAIFKLVEDRSGMTAMRRRFLASERALGGGR